MLRPSGWRPLALLARYRDMDLSYLGGLHLHHSIRVPLRDDYLGLRVSWLWLWCRLRLQCGVWGHLLTRSRWYDYFGL